DTRRSLACRPPRPWQGSGQTQEWCGPCGDGLYLPSHDLLAPHHRSRRPWGCSGSCVRFGMSEIHELGVDTPVGPLTLRERDGVIAPVGWGKPKAAEEPTPLLLSAAAQLDGYFFCNLERFELPLAPGGSEFDRQVWDAMLEIPYGRTLT